MPDNPVLGYINHFRILIDDIAEGRIEARLVKDMTDDQIGDYIARRQAELRGRVEEGFQMHETPENP